MIGVVVVVRKERRGAFSAFSTVPTSVMVGNEVQKWGSTSSFWFYSSSSFSVGNCHPLLGDPLIVRTF